jgi:glycosyltransferase involved in cell wall biosynthesis
VDLGILLQQTTEIRRPPFDGPANHTRAVFHALRELGHTVRLVARSEDGIWASDDLRNYRLLSVPRADRGWFRFLERGVRRSQRALRLPYANLFESRRFALAVCQELAGADLLYERFSWMGWGGGWAASRLKRPLVVEYNGDPLLDLEAKGIAPRGLQRSLSLRMTRRSLRRAAHIVASGEGWRRQFVERWGLDPQHVTVIENGSSLVERLRRQDLRSFDGVEGTSAPLRVVYLGGFQPWQGVDILLRAIQKAVAEVDLQLWLIGAGVGLAEARRQVDGAHLESRVVFTGNLPAEEFGPLLARSDIGVSSYCGWREYSGLKLLEYKAAGLAIIASGDADQPRTLRHGETGWLVPPCDEAALAAALIHLAKDPGLRRRLGQAARQDAERQHSWSETGRRLTTLFRQVQSGRSQAMSAVGSPT